jgi:DNA-binding NarL/FixJ family response regulator
VIRVALIDDHVSFRGALAFMIERDEDISVVVQAGRFEETRAFLEREAIDVALVDLDLPDGNGLDLLPLLRERNPDSAVVILTGSIKPENPGLAIANGAVGFLHKSVSTADVIDAIKRAAAGEALFSATEAVSLLRQAAQYQSRVQTTQRVLDQLTPREIDVLEALADGLDNQAIADRLFLSTATVRTHVREILRKLNVNSRLQAALYAVRLGVVKLDEPD